jgi:SAM-dependent methyltransferase
MSDKPPVGGVRFGDFDRIDPIGAYFSRGRGTSVDRFYIARFLEQHAADVKGRFLEIEENRYAAQFGGDRLTRVDVLDIWPENPRATIIGDLVSSETLPRASFDCIICAQTLQFIYDARAAIASLHAALKHGGVLLATMPGISQVQSETGEVHWSFTRASAARMFGDVFGKEHVAAESHGNVFAAVCMLHGVAAQEAPQEKLIYQDDAYPVIVAVRAVKGAA